jgi:hypothetical protein
MGLLKPCADGSCERLVPADKRLCVEHARADNARRNARGRAYGYGRMHWRRLRRLRIIRAGGRCELRLPGCTGHATHVHLDPSLAGNHDQATIHDVRAYCAPCSGAVDAPRAARLGRALEATRDRVGGPTDGRRGEAEHVGRHAGSADAAARLRSGGEIGCTADDRQRARGGSLEHVTDSRWDG